MTYVWVHTVGYKEGKLYLKQAVHFVSTLFAAKSDEVKVDGYHNKGEDKISCMHSVCEIGGIKKPKLRDTKVV